MTTTLIQKEQLKPILSQLKEEGYTLLISIVAVDLKGKFELNYTVFSVNENADITLKTETKGEIETISEIYPSAIFEEREIFDMFGINFVGHPDLKRILMPESWAGFPLRKDYELKDERLIWNN